MTRLVIFRAFNQTSKIIRRDERSTVLGIGGRVFVLSGY